MAEAETKHCSNCKRDIPANNFIMHQSHCARNISLCKHCGETVPHKQRDQHFEEVHAKVNCECGESVEKQHIEDHKKNECNLRIKMCRYCEMEVTVKDLVSHEDFCGSRTESCPKCSRYICFKDREIHDNSDCYLPEQPPPPAATMHNKLHDNHSFLQEEPDSYQAFAAGYRYGGPQVFDDGFTIDHSFGMFGQTAAPAVRVPRNIDERKHRKNKSRVQNLLGERSKPDNRKSHTSQHSLSNPDDMDFLARHLAHDLSKDTSIADGGTAVSESDIDTILQEAYNIPDPPSDLTSLPNHQRYSDFAQPDVHVGQDDSAKLPCEFCNKLVSEQDLILHQSGCQYDQMQASREARHSQGGLLSRGPPPIRIPSPPTSPSNGNTQSDDTDAEILMLPCEFCSELLPAESIPFHQPTCDMNRTTTPLPSDNNNHPLDPSNMLRAANTRPKLKPTQVTKKNPLRMEDDDIGIRNNRVFSVPYQQESVQPPSPVDRYAPHSMTNYSSMNGRQIPPSRFYGNPNRRGGSHGKKQSSSQSSVQAKETLQAFLDDDTNPEVQYADDSDTFAFNTLSDDRAYVSTYKKSSNTQQPHEVSKNSKQGKRDPYAALATHIGQEQNFRPKNSSSHHHPANRSGAPANRSGGPANRSGEPVNRSGAPANRNEVPANYSKKDPKGDKKPSKSRKKSSDAYANLANNIGQKPSTENHAEQVRMFTEREKAQRQKTVNTAGNGTKPKRPFGNQQLDGDTHPVYQKSHDQRARNSRTKANYHATSRQMTLDPNDELESTLRTGRTQPTNNIHARQVKKPPGPGTGSNC